MGIPEDQAPPTVTVPAQESQQGATAHRHHVDSTSVSSASTINKADEALDEKNGKLATDVTENEKGNEVEIQVDGESETEDHTNYPHGLKLVTLIIALSLAVFLVALDQTIIATAIPKITDRFHSINDIGWYGSAYFLTSTALQPSFGRIYKVFQIKWVFLSAIGVFELGSLICAVAPSSTALIVGRAIAGIGVGGIFSGALVIIAHSGTLYPQSP
jgi:hypothetical protein